MLVASIACATVASADVAADELPADCGDVGDFCCGTDRSDAEACTCNGDLVLSEFPTGDGYLCEEPEEDEDDAACGGLNEFCCGDDVFDSEACMCDDDLVLSPVPTGDGFLCSMPSDDEDDDMDDEVECGDVGELCCGEDPTDDTTCMCEGDNVLSAVATGDGYLCEAPEDSDDVDDSDDGDDPAECICTRQFEPMCSLDTETTYQNMCEAVCADDVENLVEGRCRDIIATVDATECGGDGEVCCDPEDECTCTGNLVTADFGLPDGGRLCEACNENNPLCDEYCTSKGLTVPCVGGETGAPEATTPTTTTTTTTDDDDDTETGIPSNMPPETPATATGVTAAYTQYVGKDYIPSSITGLAANLVSIEDIGTGLVVDDVAGCEDACTAEPSCNAASFYNEAIAGTGGKNCYLKVLGDACMLPTDAIDDAGATLSLKCPEGAPGTVSDPSIAGVTDIATDDTDAESATDVVTTDATGGDTIGGTPVVTGTPLATPSSPTGSSDVVNDTSGAASPVFASAAIAVAAIGAFAMI